MQMEAQDKLEGVMIEAWLWRWGSAMGDCLMRLIFLSIYLSTDPPIYLPFDLSTYLPIYLSTYCFCIYLSIYLSVYLSIFLSNYICVFFPYLFFLLMQSDLIPYYPVLAYLSGSYRIFSCLILSFTILSHPILSHVL